ncbi:hypothetical protein HDU86_001664 [Geranomyces michiganensis]|nr:hypothetical protein HDU86_001664 [Geranomyces michiganensis]
MPLQSNLPAPSATPQNAPKHGDQVTATTPLPDTTSQQEDGAHAAEEAAAPKDDKELDTLTQQKEQYRHHMSPIEYTYFDTFTLEDRRMILDGAKEALQARNVEQIKAKTFGMQFLGNVSHELRTPLNGLIGAIDLMQGEEMSTSQRLYIKTLEQSCTHLLSVVSRMQDLAALQNGKPTNNIMPFDMRATITGVAESMQHMSIHTGRGTQVALDLDPQIPRSVNGDLTKVQQILANLVGIAAISSLAKYAALKATFQALDGGAAKIHFIIKGVQSQTPKTLLEGFDLDFSFEDLFKPLTPVNLSHGVVICREFLKQLGSRLHMDVDAKNSLIFEFSLDVTYDIKIVGHEKEDALKEAQLAVSILVAEDNKVSRRIAMMMLKKLGFMNVDGVENGQEVLTKLQSKTYDVILMDCDMPVMDGYEATEHIRTKLKNTTVKIVALTANSTNEARQRCIATGMDDYFTKPITMKTLSEMLHKWLRHGPLPFLGGV